MKDLVLRYKNMMKDPQQFAAHVSRTPLRTYQHGVMKSVVDSVLQDRGFSFVVMFPRQSGKNELQALLESYLITLFSHRCVEMIKICPTLHPQARVSMHRFENVMRRNRYLKKIWKKEEGNAYRMGGARLTFLSGAPTSNIVGATASGLLEVDEAQQVRIEKFERDVAPMCASTNATRVFWGTAWTSITLLGRELRAAQEAEKRDGIRRVFRLTAEDVCAEVPAYRQFVEEKIARQGRNHPLVRTQYFCEEVDGSGGMFPAERTARMRAVSKLNHGHARSVTALLLDVAGEDEGVRGIDGLMSAANPSRDATALTLVEIVLDDESDDFDSNDRMGDDFFGDNRMVGLDLPSSNAEAQKISAANPVDEVTRQPTLRGNEKFGNEIPRANNRQEDGPEGFCCDNPMVGRGLENHNSNNRMVGLDLPSSNAEAQKISAANPVDEGTRQPTLRGNGDFGNETPQPNRRGNGKSGNETPQSTRRVNNGLPIYRPIKRWQWIGANHTLLQAAVREIALEYKARAVVVDATGVGAGLASFLDRALPGRVTPFVFSSASKSQLGWDFLSIVDSCRWQEPFLEDLPGNEQLRYQNEFFTQLAACQFEVKSDAKHTMRWSVPDGSRNPLNGELLHDDWVLSAALCAVLEKMDWAAPTETFIVKASDPLMEMDEGF